LKELTIKAKSADGQEITVSFTADDTKPKPQSIVAVNPVGGLRATSAWVETSLEKMRV
jgi:hypothetical protein